MTRLFKRIFRLIEEMEAILNNIYFQDHDEETKRHFYKAVDELKIFLDNIKI